MLIIGLFFCLFSGSVKALPPEYESAVKKLETHSPQPRYSVDYLEFLHRVYAGPTEDGTPRLSANEAATAEAGGLAVLPPGVSRPEVPQLPQSLDPGFRETTAAQFKLAREMAQHAFIEVNHRALFASLPVEDRQEALAELYKRWSDESCKDTVFKSENLKRLLDYWIAVYEAECLAELEARLEASDISDPQMRGRWMAKFLAEIEALGVHPTLAVHRQRDVLRARESVQESFAAKHLDRYLERALPEDAEHVLSLLHLRLRDKVSQPKLTRWLIENADSIDVLVKTLSIELWDSAFVSYSVAGLNESADALAARLRDAESNPFEHMHRKVDVESTFLFAFHQFLLHSLPRLQLGADRLLTALVDSLLEEGSLLNYRVATFLEAMQNYIEAHPTSPHLNAIETALRRLVTSLSGSEFEAFSWQLPAIGEAQTVLYHLVVQRRGWNAGTEASAVDMLAVLDNPGSDALDRAAAHYALSQFGPQVFGDLLEARYANPAAGGEPFARCIRALFEALEVSPPPEPQ
ncbi:MAG: hypothetical protein R3B54_00395 [Bdellovibrionota bacterium]